jgi:hypothetical protein
MGQQRPLATGVFKNKVSLHNTLNKWKGLGLVACKPGRGRRPSTWEWTGRGLDETILPRPDEVAAPAPVSVIV